MKILGSQGIRTWTFLVLAFGLGVGATGTASGAVLRVEADGSGAYPTIQAAFDAASAGDVVELGPGVYDDHVVRTVFYGTAGAIAHMSPGVSIQGADGASATILDGQGITRGLYGEAVGAVEIRGITFRDCICEGSTDFGTYKWGGGVLVFDSEVTIRDCAFVQCTAPLEGGGGGVMLYNGSGAHIEGCLFLRNYADDIGGGLELYQIASAAVVRNTFVDNDSDRGGGALLLNGSATMVESNVFAGNSGNLSGGAILCLNGAATTATCNVFWQNQAPANEHTAGCGIDVLANDNVVADPLFCDPVVDDYSVFRGSPADPDESPVCGQRGAFPVGCSTVALTPVTWSRLKASHRDPR
ncbi:MAG: right-handed parallel beta-helix repeat-containing protein [Gemmatimonadetes bacterium]|nr:right-handed parallel beta-helix repeat-containing protein [Gemmatimonadota bacterium]